MAPIPRLIIAGTQSGVGKTSLSLGLVAALTRRGLRVQTYKVGPDFLDPSYLALASGRPCYNLDGWMSGEGYVRGLFTRTSQDADICIIEGVMGLFDGADALTSEGSTAEIAEWLDASILLVTNAHGAARSLAATVKGFAEFDPKINVAGVLANHTGSERHAAWLEDSLKGASLPPLVGAIPRGALPELPSRHLGLVTADQKNLSESTLGALADAIERHVSLDAIIRLAANVPSLDMPRIMTNTDVAWNTRGVRERDARTTSSFQPLRLGIAYDEAFHFYYQDVFDELESQGFELIRFSPIHDSHLPLELCALYIGGGYPEEHAKALSQNESMLADMRRFADEGYPIYAECGGLMYLADGVKTLDDHVYPLTGIMPATVQMLPRKKMLGYIEVQLTRASLWGAQGAVIRGHEFHYSELVSEPFSEKKWNQAYTLSKRRSSVTTSEGFQCGRILASYVHLHLASQPEAITHFYNLCRETTPAKKA